MGTDIFSYDCIKQCKDNANEDQFLPLEVNIYKLNGNGTRIICTSRQAMSKGF